MHYLNKHQERTFDYNTLDGKSWISRKRSLNAIFIGYSDHSVWYFYRSSIYFTFNEILLSMSEIHRMNWSFCMTFLSMIDIFYLQWDFAIDERDSKDELIILYDLFIDHHHISSSKIFCYRWSIKIIVRLQIDVNWVGSVVPLLQLLRRAVQRAV